MEQETKISELPNLTSLNAADLLAIVQSGVTGHAQLSALLDLIAANLSSIESNGNGLSFRVGQGATRMQIATHRLAFPSDGQPTRTLVWTFPQEFSDAANVRVFATIEGGATSVVSYGMTGAPSATSVGLEITLTSGGVGGRALHVLAVGPA